MSSKNIYHIEKSPEAILLVKQIEDHPVGKGLSKKHGSVTAAGIMGTLEQPQGIAIKDEDKIIHNILLEV